AGDANYFKSHHMTDMPDEAIERLIRGHQTVTGPQHEIHVHDMRGAVARQPEGGSAFPFREAPYGLNVLAQWPVASGAGAEHVEWTRDVVASLEEYGTGATYVNYQGDTQSTETLRASYGPETYDRLVAAKDKWDPDNVFHLNQNITPSR